MTYATSLPGQSGRYLRSMLACSTVALCAMAAGQEGPVSGNGSAPGSAPVTPDWSTTASVTAVSDYIFRGVSQTQGKPMVQETLDVVHVSGAYFGLFGSGVSYAAYNNGRDAEIDVYGGYRYGFAQERNVDLGLVTYWYPGAHYLAGGNNITYHTQDLKLGYNDGHFNVYGWYTLSRHWFGFTLDPATGKLYDTRGTTYIEANWNPALTETLALNVHLGRQCIHNMGAFNFTDLKLGLDQAWGNWSAFAGATYNNGDAYRGALAYWTFFDADGRGSNVVGRRWLMTVGRSF